MRLSNQRERAERQAADVATAVEANSRPRHGAVLARAYYRRAQQLNVRSLNLAATSRPEHTSNRTRPTLTVSGNELLG